jgi:hypothetical protein
VKFHNENVSINTAHDTCVKGGIYINTPVNSIFLINPYTTPKDNIKYVRNYFEKNIYSEEFFSPS